ncbi:MAG: ABC transporter permease [Lachnospiraceae bacterium]|uniref:ABC transporter permease n=1 Tax=Parablautia sp. Marseille-Q6255 TaxID=3039593 RepID=UPI0024BD273D|nr:ABC transporter permease [Parablautia sp. Marseille-Q6255]
MDKKRGVSQTQLDYLQGLKRRQYRITAVQILIFVVFLLLWETAVQLGWIDGFIFSSPSRVLKTFGMMWKDRSIFLHTGITLAETLISFVLVVVAGVSISVVLWYNTELSEILEPYLVVLNSLPKSALAPLLIVWLGANMKSIIVAGISIAIFGTVLNLYTGFREMDPDKVKLIYTLQGRRTDVLSKVILPGTVPLLVSVMKVNIGLCLVGVVIGEFIGARQGLGYLIIYGSQVFKLDWVIMSIVILCLIAMALYGVLGIIERRCRKDG